MVNPTPVPSNVPRPSSGLPTSSAAPSPSVPSKEEPRIKTEPGTEPKPTNLPPNYVNNDARERAMAALHQKFGGQAGPQIHQIQSQMNRGPVHHPQGQTMTPEQRQQQAEYMRRQQAAHYQQMQHARQQGTAVGGPSDGAKDWNGYVANQRARAQETSKEADQSIRNHVEQMHRSIEGGGLMMPLSEQSDVPSAKRQKMDDGPAGAPKISQTDGVADDDDDDESKADVKDELFEEDEDAINSDLDDPDENEIEEEEDDGKPTQVMLCTYDKVQRVKNKWKCTLKDGVLNVNGRE